MQALYSNLNIFVTEILKAYFPNMGVSEGTKITICIVLSSMITASIFSAIAKIQAYFKKVIIINTQSNDYYFVITKNSSEFSMFMSYIRSKYEDNISGVMLNGVNNKSYPVKFKNDRLEDKYDEHIVYISFDCDELKDESVKQNDANKVKKNTINDIVLHSKTANAAILCNYMDKCSKNYDKDIEELVVNMYYLTKVKTSEQSFCKWTNSKSNTNRSLDNTFFSDDIMNNFIGNIEGFIGDERKYRKKGRPYKIGYLLHGLAGNGKSTLVKIISSHFKMPIFIVDCTVFEGNSEFNEAINKIKDIVRESHHVILFEDLDRFLKNRKKDSCITEDCLLNMMEGIDEPHGRIVIITTNVKEEIVKVPSLVRAGRVDHIIELGYCTIPQIQKTIDFYYEDELIVDEESMIIKEDVVIPKQLDPKILITASKLAQLLQIFVSKNDLIMVINEIKNFVGTDAADTIIYQQTLERLFQGKPVSEELMNSIVGVVKKVPDAVQKPIFTQTETSYVLLIQDRNKIARRINTHTSQKRKKLDDLLELRNEKKRIELQMDLVKLKQVDDELNPVVEKIGDNNRLNIILNRSGVQKIHVDYLNEKKEI